MEVTVTKLEGCRRKLEIIVPGEEPDKAYKEMLEDFRRSLQVPGFRKGKVPASVIERRFGQELVNEVVEKLVPKALSEAIEQEGLQPVEQPVRDDVQYDRGGPLRIVASFEVRPDVELKKHTGITVEIDPAAYETGDAEVDEQLQGLRERSATFEPVELVRPIQLGDFVVINLRGEPAGEGAAPWRREDVTAQVVDAGEDGGFSANLIGAQVEQNRKFTVEYPEDFEDEVLAGSTVSYEVEIKQLKKRILPELDDEFARDLGQFETLDDLRKAVRSQLEAEKRRARREDVERKLVDALIEENPPFEPPRVMVQRELARMENELRRTMISRGVNPDHMGFDWSAFRTEAREQAEWNVRRILFLDTIADKEGVEVSAKEVRAEIDAIAASAGRDPRELRREMLEDGRFEALGSHIRDHKTTDWLARNNIVKEVKK